MCIRKGRVRARAPMAAALLATAWLGLGPASAQVPAAPEATTEADCDPTVRELIEAVRQWMRAGNHADWDETAFWSSLTGPQRTRDVAQTPNGLTEGNLGTYLLATDGNKWAPPIRTGREVALYRAIKTRILAAPATDRITQAELLRMALDANANASGHANLQSVFLTLHNVLRVMARPRAWALNWDEVDLDDPMHAIFADLQGAFPGGNPRSKDPSSLAAQLAAKFDIRMDNGGVTIDGTSSDSNNMYWPMKLFGPDAGSFEVLRGTVDGAANSGAHYYAWVGAIGQGAIGFAEIGAYVERAWKWADDAGERGRRQLRQFWCGAALADGLYALRGELRNDGGLSILSLDYPNTLTAGQNGDVEVTWGGTPTMPLALVIEPASGCPSDCQSASAFSATRTQPIVGYGVLGCKPSTTEVTYRYTVHLADANGGQTTGDPVTYTCLPSTGEGVVNVSGELDRVIAQQKIDYWNGLGFTQAFPSSAAWFRLLEDGTALVSPVILFKSDSFARADPTRTYDHITRYFYTRPGTGTVERAGGSLWQCFDRSWHWGIPRYAYCADTMVEGSWWVQRQADGSYFLNIANGLAAGYADIPYRLR